jgi:hypothetical protein
MRIYGTLHDPQYLDLFVQLTGGLGRLGPGIISVGSFPVPKRYPLPF